MLDNEESATCIRMRGGPSSGLRRLQRRRQPGRTNPLWQKKRQHEPLFRSKPVLPTRGQSLELLVAAGVHRDRLGRRFLRDQLLLNG